MTEAMASDLTLVSFADDAEVRAVVEVSSRLARELRPREEAGAREPEELAAGARKVRELHLADVVNGASAGSHMATTVFHVADALAAASPTAAWQGLSAVPAALALKLSGHDPAQLPLAIAARGPSSGWLLLRPLVRASEPAGTWLPQGETLLELSEIPLGHTNRSLLGFPHGAVTRIDSGTGCSCRRFTLTEVALERLSHFAYALLGGLLSGALRRMVEEAYAYARIRASAGKPINHHQAVMLRLADLAIQQQSLALYLQETVERPREIGCPGGVLAINVDYIVSCTSRIAEDTVQVAAGHGYVEGLPFKRLFGQTRALASSVALLLEGS